MLKIRFLIIIVLTSYGVRAQHTREVAQFNHDFNQSLSVRDLAITADGKEAFFTIQSPFQEISQIAFIKKENNTWSEPELMPFSDAFSYLNSIINSLTIPSNEKIGIVYILILCTLDWLWRKNERDPLNIPNKYIRYVIYSLIFYSIIIFNENSQQFIYFLF